MRSACVTGKVSMFRFSLATAILGGLLQYDISPLEPNAVPNTTQSQKDQKSSKSNALLNRVMSKKKRKRLQKETKVELDLGAADKIIQVSLSEEILQEMEFFGVYDNMVFFGVIVIANNLAGILGQLLFGVPNNLAPILTLIGVFVGIYALAKVEMLSDLTPSSEKWYVGMIALVSSIITFFGLLLLPESIVNFQLEAAASSFGAAIAETLEKAGKEYQQGTPGVALDPIVLVGLVSLFSGTVGSLLFTAATRVVRCHQLMQFPPVQLQEHVSSGPLVIATIQIQMLVVITCCILWLKPLVDMFGVPSHILQIARAAMFLLWSAIQFGLLRPLMQAFFHSALVQWYNVRHTCGHKKDEDSISYQIQMKVAVNSFLTCKVAVQILAPPFILTCFGFLLASRGIPHFAPVTQGMFTTDLVHCCAGFTAWWMCLSWSVYSVLTLTMFRRGLLVT